MTRVTALPVWTEYKEKLLEIFFLLEDNQPLLSLDIKINTLQLYYQWTESINPVLVHLTTATKVRDQLGIVSNPIIHPYVHLTTNHSIKIEAVR